MRVPIVLMIVGLMLSNLTPISAQVRLGIKGGLSTSDVPASHLLIFDQSDAERFSLAVADAKYGLHLGLFLQAQAGHFFIQPEVLFNTVSMDYTVDDLQDLSPGQVNDEMYRNLDIPVILGLKFGPVRLGGGPVGHLFLDSTSDLDYDGYEPEFKKFTFGWQAGLGLDIWKLHFDARYEGNFEEFGSHFVFYGRRYAFSDSPSRLILSAGISF